MSSIARGGKNAFRNVIRTVSIALIVGLSIGLALVMLLSLKAVQTRIDTVESAIGNTITVSPAGARGFQGGGEPLTATEMNTVKGLTHVVKVTEVLNGRLQASTDTPLQSAIEPGTLGERDRQFQAPDGAQPRGDGGTTTPSVPIFVFGTNDLENSQAISGNKLTIKSGQKIDATGNQDVALVGKGLADKNTLKAGSTFQAYGATITVVGVFDAGNTFANSGVVLPLKTLQRLSGQTDEVSSAQVQVDSIGNADSVAKAIEKKLGDKADVVTPQDTSSQALAPLTSIKNIATYSLAGSLVAGAVIIFLSMLMIVRERRREIGVLKAIGASSVRIVTQFVTESFVLTLFGSVIGAVIGVALSNTILGALVASSSSVSQRGAGRGFGAMRMMLSGPGMRSAAQGITATVGYEILLYGLLAAVIVATVGSAIPAWFIARIRPAEVMRSE